LYIVALCDFFGVAILECCNNARNVYISFLFTIFCFCFYTFKTPQKSDYLNDFSLIVLICVTNSVKLGFVAFTWTNLNLITGLVFTIHCAWGS